jgi:sec-independent protein translocase protein TatB
MELFGISFENMLLILVVALIIFGPERLPEIAGKIGRWINDFRRMSTEVRQEVSQELKLGDFQKLKEEVTGTIQETRKEFQDLKSEVNVLASDTKKELDEIKNEVKEALPYEQSYFSVVDNNKSEEEKTRLIDTVLDESPVTATTTNFSEVTSPFAAAVAHSGNGSGSAVAAMTETLVETATESQPEPVAPAPKAVGWKSALRGARTAPTGGAGTPDYHNQEQYFGKRNHPNGATNESSPEVTE